MSPCGASGWRKRAVRLVGWRGLGISATEEERIRELMNRHIQRLLTMLHDIMDVSVHVKKASKQGMRHRYNIHLTALGSGKYFYADTTDWDLRAAVHKAFVSIENQVKRREWHAREHIDAFASSPEPLLRM